MDVSPAGSRCAVKRAGLPGALVVFCSGVFAQSSTTNTISDAVLLSYASHGYGKRTSMNTSVVLGINHGAQVIADFPCSDLCPAYTVRVIHYDVPLSKCPSVDGVVRDLLVPMGIAMGTQRFCFPKVLTDNWDRYVR